MYAKFLVKESFLGEFHALLEGMRLVFWSSFKLLGLMFSFVLEGLYAFWHKPKLIKREAPDKYQEVDLAVDRLMNHHQQPLNRLYMR